MAKAKRINGELPPIPEEIRNSTDPATATLLQAMEMCYRYNPSERPTAQQIVKFLTDSIESLENSPHYEVQLANTT